MKFKLGSILKLHYSLFVWHGLLTIFWRLFVQCTKGVHGLGKIEASLSDYYMVDEIQNIYRGMMITISAEKWIIFASFSPQKLAAVLLKLVHKVRLKRFLKQPRSQEEERPSSMRPASSPCLNRSTFQVTQSRQTWLGVKA